MPSCLASYNHGAWPDVTRPQERSVSGPLRVIMTLHALSVSETPGMTGVIFMQGSVNRPPLTSLHMVAAVQSQRAVTWRIFVSPPVVIRRQTHGDVAQRAATSGNELGRSARRHSSQYVPGVRPSLCVIIVAVRCSASIMPTAMPTATPLSAPAGAAVDTPPPTATSAAAGMTATSDAAGVPTAARLCTPAAAAGVPTAVAAGVPTATRPCTLAAAAGVAGVTTTAVRVPAATPAAVGMPMAGVPQTAVRLPMAGVPTAMPPSAPAGAAAEAPTPTDVAAATRLAVLMNAAAEVVADEYSTAASAREHGTDGTALVPAPAATAVGQWNHTQSTAASTREHGGHPEVPSQQHDQTRLSMSGSSLGRLQIERELLPLRKNELTETHCKKVFRYAPYLVNVSSREVSFRTANAPFLPMNATTIALFQTQLRILHAAVIGVATRYYEKLIVTSFQSSGFLRHGGCQSPRSFQDVMNILRSRQVTTNFRQHASLLLAIAIANLWNPLDDPASENGMVDELKGLVGPHFTFDERVKISNNQTVKHMIVRIGNQARDGIMQKIQDFMRSYGFMLHKNYDPKRLKFKAHANYGDARSYTFPLRIDRISRDPRVVAQCKRGAVTVTKKILPPWMVDRKPTDEQFHQWLVGDSMQVNIIMLVQQAIRQGVSPDDLVCRVRAAYTNERTTFGCHMPGANAPQPPNGTQMSGSTNHNTGANKVSPICERPLVDANVNDGTHVGGNQFSDDAPQTNHNVNMTGGNLNGEDHEGDRLLHDPASFFDRHMFTDWESPMKEQDSGLESFSPLQINTNTGTPGRENDPTPNTNQTTAKVRSP